MGGDMAELKETMRMLMSIMMAEKTKGLEAKSSGDRWQGRLEGRHYCRMERFSGGGGFKGWAEDMMITTGSQDKELEAAMKNIMRTKTLTTG